MLSPLMHSPAGKTTTDALPFWQALTARAATNTTTAGTHSMQGATRWATDLVQRLSATYGSAIDCVGVLASLSAPSAQAE